jgi:hypothetical protein
MLDAFVSSGPSALLATLWHYMGFLPIARLVLMFYWIKQQVVAR